MEISYKDGKLRKLCENSREASRKLGADSAGKLRRRLAEIDAADNVNELIAGSPHPLEGDKSGQFSLALAGGQRLVFTPDHDPIPLKDDTGINWLAVTAVTIIYIGDYHD